MQYDTIAVNTIVKNKEGEVSSCDLSYNAELNQFNEEYLKYTAQVAASCQDRDLSENSMVIGTSAIIDTEIDGAVGMNSGIFNNPFIIWGRYKKKWFRYYLPISFQFHQTGAHFVKDGKMYRVPRREQIAQARKAGIDYKVAAHDLPLCALEHVASLRKEPEQLSLL